ncbi:MAG: DMT family transporter, partial [Bacteroidota bacterium]
MKNTKSFSSLFELNLAVLLISTSGVLGRYIELPVPLTIFLRALLACTILLIFVVLKRYSLKVKSEDKKTMLLSGIFMGLHWITYFYSLQISNVAIAIISLYTFPVITAFLEPLLLKTPFHKSHIVSGLLVIIGIYILAPEIDFSSNNFRGATVGVLSALCYALRNIIIKPKVHSYNQSSIMFFQMVVVTILLIPTIHYFNYDAVKLYFPALLLLALVTTVIGHTLFVKSLKYFSASSASLISSMQPLYGILLAFLFLGEEPSPNTFIGGTLVVSAVV